MNKSSVNEHLKSLIFDDRSTLERLEIASEYRENKDGSYIEHVTVKPFPVIPNGHVIFNVSAGRHPGKQHAYNELMNYAYTHPEQAERAMSLAARIREEIKLEDSELKGERV